MFLPAVGKLACNVRGDNIYDRLRPDLHPSRLQHIIHSVCCSRVLFFIFKSQSRMETLNAESSRSSLPTSSIYFTSILPPPATAQDEEIQMRDSGRARGNDGVEVVRSYCDDIGNGELRINGVRPGEERRNYCVERRVLL